MERKNKRQLFILYAALSLDGRITDGRKEGSDWTSREDKKFFQSELDKADVVIMGRKTFEAIKRPLTPRNRIVFTRSSSSVIFLKKGIQNRIPFSGTPAQLHRLLREQQWTRIAIVGGTSIYDWFLKRTLVDEMYLTLEPVAFGSGKPFTNQNLRHPTRFRLFSIKKLAKQGALVLHYKS
ncbi:MAG: dihydrofolate reductase family protein [Patescibacteria group bacterium]